MTNVISSDDEYPQKSVEAWRTQTETGLPKMMVGVVGRAGGEDE
jgi:hypothetical protein